MATTLKLDHTHTPTRSRSLKCQVSGSESVPGLLAAFKYVEACWSAWSVCRTRRSGCSIGGVPLGLGLVASLWVLGSPGSPGSPGAIGRLGNDSTDVPMQLLQLLGTRSPGAACTCLTDKADI